MKSVNAFKCDFCTKILLTRSGMRKHEKRCFQNPASKSCITCGNMQIVNFLNGEEITKREREILEHKVPGTYTVQEFINGDKYLGKGPVLTDEYRYLYQADAVQYCRGFRCELKKLCTGCHKWAKKQEDAK